MTTVLDMDAMTPAAPKTWLPSYLAAALIWGLSFYFIEILLISFHPFMIAFMRLSIGAVIMLITAAIMKERLPVELWRKLFVMGILMNSLPGLMFAIAQDHISSILASILNAATPLVTLLMVIVFFREQKSTNSQFLGLVIGLLGVLTVLGIWQGIPSSQFIGIIALMAAVTGYGISMPYYRKHIVPLNYSPISLMALQIPLSALQVLPLAIFNYELRSPVSLHAIISILLLGGFGSGLAYVLHYRVTATAGAVVASSITYLMPVVAAVAGVFLLQEKLHWYEFAGALIVIIGILLTQRKPRSRHG